MNENFFIKGTLKVIIDSLVICLIISILFFNSIKTETTDLISGDITEISIDTKNQNQNEINYAEWYFKIKIKNTTKNSAPTTIWVGPFKNLIKKTISELIWLKNTMEINPTKKYQIKNLEIVERDKNKIAFCPHNLIKNNLVIKN